MFKTVLRWLGLGPAAPAPQDAFQQLDEVAPLKSTQAEASEPATNNTPEVRTFVCREELLDRSERIAGYQFALERNLQSPLLDKSAKLRRVYDDAMLQNLVPLGVSSMLGDRFAFIRVSPVSLRNPLLKTFAHRNVVIMVTPGAMAEADLAGLRTDLQYLREIGVKQGWTLDRPLPGIAEFLDQAELIEIETTALDGIQLKEMCADFRAAKAGTRLIASEIRTSDDFSLCYRSGFDYFMGPFVASHENWHPPKSKINRLLVFEVLSMIRSGAEFGVISERLRNDPILTFKLLRYINSPGIGLVKHIDKISQALLILGREQFYRWLSLLLFDLDQPGYVGRVLNERALTRARFMETLAGRGAVRGAADKLFLIGLFSLLDVMMGQALPDILRQVALPEDVLLALQGEPGGLRDALSLAIAVELKSPDEIAAAALLCELAASEVTGLMLEALDWAHHVISVGE